MDCPCKGCTAPKRHTACHGHCKEYIDWAKEVKTKKQKEHLESEIFWTRYKNHTRREKKYAAYIYKKIR